MKCLMLFIFCSLCRLTPIHAQSWLLGDERYTRNDTIEAIHVDKVPVIDGSPFDRCWDYADWYPINVPWLVTDETGKERPALADSDLPNEDFNGQYKVMWSAATNKIYMLVRVIDDVWVTGYTDGLNFNEYDGLEIFIDANGPCRSGPSVHTFNNKAYTFHVVNGPNQEPRVLDLFSATDDKTENYYWQSGDYSIVDFSDLVNVATKRYEEEHATVYEIEFSLPDIQRKPVKLSLNKIIGFSMAYCDSDNPTQPVRKSYTGSIELPADHINDSYRDASYFGILKLSDPFGLMPIRYKRYMQTEKPVRIDLFPNPAAKFFSVNFSNSYKGLVEIRLYDILGKQVFFSSQHKGGFDFSHTVALSSLSSGFYMVEVKQGNDKFTYKLKKE
jgi:hypothetical protein